MSELHFTLAKLADMLGTDLQGSGDISIRKLATLQNASSDSLSFLFNPAYHKFLADTHAGAVILSPDIAKSYSGNALIHAQPYVIFAKATHLFDTTKKPAVGIHPSASVSNDADIHPTVIIGPNTTVESGVSIKEHACIDAGAFIGANTHIGEYTHIKSNTNLCHDIVIGSHCLIHEGAVIGSDGFGFANDGENWLRIAQLGRVIIGNYVEVGANTTIDRGALEDTIIEDSVILDNQIQIAHNVRIGHNTAIAANVGIAGSTEIGAGCMIGGGAGINGHLKIANGVMISGMAIITKSIMQPNTQWSPGGVRSLSMKDWRKNASRFRHLNELFKRVKSLEKQIDGANPKN